MQPLLKDAGPDLYDKNGFRVLQLPVDSTARVISRRRGTVDKALQNGLPVPEGPGCALPFPGPIVIDDIVLAAQRLSDPNQRLLDELFWFWSSRADDPAFTFLREGKRREAETLWLEREDDPEFRTYSQHNLAVLYHLGALEAERAGSAAPDPAGPRIWDKAYRRWVKVVQDPQVWDHLRARARELDDPRLLPGTADQIRDGMVRFLGTITAQLAIEAVEAQQPEKARRLLDTLRSSGMNAEAVQNGIRDAVAPVRSRVTAICKAAESVAAATPELAGDSCRQLIETGTAILAVLDALLDPTDGIRQAAHDELAERIHQTQVAYSRKTCDWASAVLFLEAAERTASSSTLKATLAKELKVVVGYRDLADDYCGPGYFQAPKEIVEALESARTHLRTHNYEETVNALSRFLKEQIGLIRSTQTLPLVRKALAFSLGSLAFDRRKRAIREFNQQMEEFNLELLAKAAARATAGLFSGTRYCMVCGAYITGTYSTATIKGVTIVACGAHQSPSDATVNAAIRRSAQDYVDAQFLDPSNNFVAARVPEIRKECGQEGISFPSTSGWLVTLIGRDSPVGQPPRPAAPAAVPTPAPAANTNAAGTGCSVLIGVAALLIFALHQITAHVLDGAGLLMLLLTGK